MCGFEAENFEQLVTITINKAVKYSGIWLEKHGLTMEAYSPEMYTTAHLTVHIWNCGCRHQKGANYYRQRLEQKT